MGKKETRHAAIVTIDESLILQWLRFEGGRILNIRTNPAVNRHIEVVVEHPDMPEVEEGKPYERVCPSYIYHFGDKGELLCIERVRVDGDGKVEIPKGEVA